MTGQLLRINVLVAVQFNTPCADLMKGRRSAIIPSCKQTAGRARLVAFAGKCIPRDQGPVFFVEGVASALGRPVVDQKRGRDIITTVADNLGQFGREADAQITGVVLLGFFEG